MLLFAVALGSLLAGCSPADTLQGSLSDEVSLGFTSVQIQQAGDQVSVSYLNAVPGSSTPDITFEIIANTTDVELAHGGSLNLTDLLSDGSTRGAVTRAVHDDPRSDFPPLTRGMLTFSANPVAGAKVTGSFEILFGDQGGELGEGRTVYGTFEGTIRAPSN